jgi:hypothetical protein
MKEAIIGTLVTVLAVTLVSFWLGGLSFLNLKFVEPEKENIRREIFENTQSYSHGKIQNLSRLRLEYKTSKDEDHKAALKEMVLVEVSTFDLNRLPDNLYNFVKELER